MDQHTELDARAFNSLLMRSDSGVRAGTSDPFLKRLTRGRPSTKRQTKESNEPNSSWTSRNRCAFLTADSTLRRLRIMPGFSRSFETRFSEYRATLPGSNASKAFR